MSHTSHLIWECIYLWPMLYLKLCFKYLSFLSRLNFNLKFNVRFVKTNNIDIQRNFVSIANECLKKHAQLITCVTLVTISSHEKLGNKNVKS
jgi:hypothetical protein